MSYGMTMADGSIWEIPDNSYPSQNDYPVATTFRDIFAGVKDVTNFALQTQQQFAEIGNAADTTSFNRFMSSLALDTSKTIAQTQAETAKTQAQAALAAAQNKQAVVSGTVSQSGKYDKIYLIAAIIGVIGVVYSMSKGK